MYFDFDDDCKDKKSLREILLNFLKKRIETGKKFRDALKRKYTDLLPKDYDK